MEWANAPLAWARQTFTRDRAREFLATHGVPLLIVALAALIPQIALRLMHPDIPASPDSREYLAVAHKILATGQFADPKRTPGYPAFLALVFILFRGQSLTPVVTIQLALCFIAAFEVYLLAYRLSANRWVAAAAGAVVGLNIYMLDWAYSIRDESLSYALTVTLFLTVERMARRPTWGAATAFVVVSTLVVMTRPFYLFLPALIGLALLARAVGLRWARRDLVALALSLVVMYGLVGGYVALNGATNGYYGVSYVSDANLFGKVKEFRMLDRPVPAQYQTIQRDAQQFASQRNDGLPWTFAREYGYTGDFYHPLGAYARYVVLHNPAAYAAGTARDTVRVWRAAPGADAGGPRTLLSRLAFRLASAELDTYLALPLALLWLAWRLGRGGWRDPALVVVTLLTLAVTGAIVMTALASYAEFYRLRAPIDWAWLLAATLLAFDAVRALLGVRARQAHAIDAV